MTETVTPVSMLNRTRREKSVQTQNKTINKLEFTNSRIYIFFMCTGNIYQNRQNLEQLNNSQ